jgi:hypothetical protein
MATLSTICTWPQAADRPIPRTATYRPAAGARKHPNPQAEALVAMLRSSEGACARTQQAPATHPRTSEHTTGLAARIHLLSTPHTPCMYFLRTPHHPQRRRPARPRVTVSLCQFLKRYRMDVSLSALAHRVTVLGSTRSIVATSAGSATARLRVYAQHGWPGLLGGCCAAGLLADVRDADPDD